MKNQALNHQVNQIDEKNKRERQEKMKQRSCNRLKNDGHPCRGFALKGKDHCRNHANRPIYQSESSKKVKCDDPNCPTAISTESICDLECGHKVHDSCMMIFVKERSAGKRRCPNCKRLLEKLSVSQLFRESLEAFSDKKISLSELKTIIGSDPSQ